MTLTKEQAKKQLLAIRKKHNMAHISVPSFVDAEYKALRQLIDQIYQSFESANVICTQTEVKQHDLDSLEYNNFIGSGWVDWQTYVKNYNSRYVFGFIDNYPNERPHMFRNKITKQLLSKQT